MDTPDVADLLPKNKFMLPRAPEGMRKFTLYRQADESGVSGTGLVIQGVLFANGKLVIQWLSGPDAGDTQIKDDWDRFLNTHVRSHLTNKTIITWEDGTQEVYEPTDQVQE